MVSRRKRSQGPRYSDLLAKPIPPPPPHRTTNVAELFDSDYARLAKLHFGPARHHRDPPPLSEINPFWHDIQYQKRIDALFVHYKVDGKSDNAWKDIALKLAEAHVPGFRNAPDHKGRPKRWTLEEDLKLLNDVRARLSRKVRVMQACVKLADTEPYKTQGIKPKSLWRRYQLIAEKNGASEEE